MFGVHCFSVLPASDGWFLPIHAQHKPQPSRMVEIAGVETEMIMKIERIVCLRNILVALLLGIALIGCKRRADHDPWVPQVNAEEYNPPTAPALNPAVEGAVRQKGDAIAAQAFGVLSSRLGKAIAEAGFTNAIQFCSVHGITITTSVGVTNEVVLRRVTHRPRNLENRADTNELAIIRKVEAELRKGATPKPVVSTHKPGYLTYYAPIVLNLPLCLSCHGQPGVDIHTNVLDEIKKTYPADEATGFKLGDLRGLWSVDFKRADFRAK